MRWLETISRWLFLLHPDLRVGMQTKVFELCPQCRCISCFFLLFNPKLVVRSLSGILSQVHIHGATSFADFHFHFYFHYSFGCTYPTLPYLTLHYSPSKEVDPIQESKSGTVRRTINIGKGTYLPTYLPRDIHVPIWATKNA